MTLAPPTWKFTSGNPATLKMFCCNTEEEFTSRNPDQYSPKYQPDGQLSSIKAKKMIDKAMYQGRNFFEWTHKRLSGEDFAATVLLSRIELDDNPCLQATVRDISQRKADEEQLKSVKELYSSILDNITTGVKVSDKNGRIIYANQKACHFINRPFENIKGAKHSSLFSKETAQKFKPYYNKAKKTHKPVRYSDIETTPKKGNRLLQSGGIIP